MTQFKVSPNPGGPTLDRRSLLEGLAAAPLGLAAGFAPGAVDAALEATLDALQAGATGPADALAALKDIPVQGLSRAGLIEYWSVTDGARIAADFERRFDFGTRRDSPSPYVVSPRSGAFTRVARALRDPKDDARAQRLETVARDMDEESHRIRADADRGVIPTGALIDSTLAAMKPVADSLNTPQTKAARVALDAQRAGLMELKARAPADPGVWRLRDGEAWYAGALAINLGALASPRKAHAEGLEEVTRLRAQADALLRRQGLAQGTVGARLRALSRDPRWLYPDSDEGRVRAVADMNLRLERARARLPALVRDVPPAVNAVSVLRMTPEDAARGRAGFRDAPPYDGSRPGGYYVDLAAIRSRPSWTLPSAVHHELLPGHLLQIPLESRARPNPYRAQFTAAYSEAWGVYAEQLADESGLNAEDPLARLGYLQWRLFRIGRLVADTGIHVMRWSAERAQGELNEIQGGSIAFITIAADVERMCVNPGQVAAQGLGARRFHRLVRASRADPRDVRSALLTYGPLPFTTADRVVASL